jgi:hypothetical protein
VEPRAVRKRPIRFRVHATDEVARGLESATADRAAHAARLSGGYRLPFNRGSLRDAEHGFLPSRIELQITCP